MEETTSTKKPRLTGTLTSPPSPSLSSSSCGVLPVTSLPFDLVEEILCRLPVKFLLQLRCVCKSWNSLISNDPEFASKQLRVSTTRQQHLVLSFSNFPSYEFNVMSYPLQSVFNNTVTMNAAMQLEFPLLKYNGSNFTHLVGSCDGILCFAIDRHVALLWNPCTRKFKKVPSSEENPHENLNKTVFSFGYDPFTDNYKVVAVFRDDCSCLTVKVYTLGTTDSWTRISDFPSSSSIALLDTSGMFLSGTVNWFAGKDANPIGFYTSRFIVSLDLEKESYQEISVPDFYGGWFVELTCGVLRDCLGIFAHNNSFTDIWLMKEYGNKESWIKLIRLPYFGDHGFFYDHTKVVYISEDDRVLLMFKELFRLKLIVYDSINRSILKSPPEIQDFNIFENCHVVSKVYVESLISPCF